MNKHELANLYTQTRQECKLPFFVVTFDPADLGNRYMACFNKLNFKVCAEHEPTEYYVTANTLQNLRRMMPDKCRIFKRERKDAPAIVETWM